MLTWSFSLCNHCGCCRSWGGYYSFIKEFTNDKILIAAMCIKTSPIKIIQNIMCLGRTLTWNRIFIKRSSTTLFMLELSFVTTGLTCDLIWDKSTLSILKSFRLHLSPVWIDRISSKVLLHIMRGFLPSLLTLPGITNQDIWKM